MAGEEWARRIVENTLRQTVVRNDDGTEDSMYDLRVGRKDAPEIAIECIGAVDAIYAETWNVGPARGPLKLAVRGDWIVEILPGARLKTINASLERILQELEELNITSATTDYWLQRQNATLFETLDTLGITHLFRLRVDGSGTVHRILQGHGGMVDTEGTSIPGWIGDFLRQPKNRDVLTKLERSGSPKCESFVIVTLSGSPWPVESYLSGGLECLPHEQPNLPHPVTGVWIVYEMARKGLRWDGTAWMLFVARDEE